MEKNFLFAANNGYCNVRWCYNKINIEHKYKWGKYGCLNTGIEALMHWF